MLNGPIRPRRLRSSSAIRDLVHETQLSPGHLIQPYFLDESPFVKQPIANFTEVYRWGIDALSKKIETDLERGVSHFLLFGRAEVSKKDVAGTPAWSDDGLVPTALRALRKRFGNSPTLFTDVCLCPYTSHGHCGIYRDGKVHNDSSLDYLGRMATAHARAGADFVAPSDMMDGRVGVIRQLLDQQGFSEVGILSYTAKYASNYYGPFREALASSPGEGDRAGYQMDFRNQREALRELRLDLAEGADLVMVKPALAYLDIISLFATESDVPVVAYSVSAEYEMVKCLAQKGLADERLLALENLTAIRRAGAKVIISYYTSEIAEKRWL